MAAGCRSSRPTPPAASPAPSCSRSPTTRCRASTTRRHVRVAGRRAHLARIRRAGSASSASPSATNRPPTCRAPSAAGGSTSTSSTIPASGSSTCPFSARTFRPGRARRWRSPRRRRGAELRAAWRAQLSVTDANAPEDESAARELARLFTDYLEAARVQGRGFSILTPGRFLMPGDLDGSPALTFSPLVTGASVDPRVPSPP